MWRNSRSWMQVDDETKDAWFSGSNQPNYYYLVSFAVTRKSDNKRDNKLESKVDLTLSFETDILQKVPSSCSAFRRSSGLSSSSTVALSGNASELLLFWLNRNIFKFGRFGLACFESSWSAVMCFQINRFFSFSTASAQSHRQLSASDIANFSAKLSRLA